MLDEISYNSAYAGTKKFNQHNVQTANATGFGAAADDYMERGIDLNEQLIMNKPATFFFKMNSNAMEAASICAGDVLIVDRSIKPTSGKIIVAAVNGELFVRRYELQGFNTILLTTGNTKQKDMVIDEYAAFSSWGVVTCVIKLLDPALIAFSKKNKTF